MVLESDVLFGAKDLGIRRRDGHKFPSRSRDVNLSKRGKLIAQGRVIDGVIARSGTTFCVPVWVEEKVTGNDLANQQSATSLAWTERLGGPEERKAKLGPTS